MKKLLIIIALLVFPLSVSADLTSDIEGCQDIWNWDREYGDNCFTDLAFEFADVEICDEVQGGNCRAEFALRFDDVAACALLRPAEFKEKCTELVNLAPKTLSACSEPGGFGIVNYGMAGECIYSLARDNKNPELCSEIFLSKIERDCRNHFLHEAVQVVPTVEEARKDCILRPSTVSENCDLDVIAEYNRVDLCDEYSYASHGKCINAVSEKHNLVSACDSHSHANYREGCILSRAVANKQPDLCEKLSNDGFNNCILHFAKENEDTALCSRLKTELTRDICVHAVERSGDGKAYSMAGWLTKAGKEAGDGSYCDEIEDETANARCLQEVAIASKNPEFCYGMRTIAENESNFKKIAQEHCLREVGGVKTGSGKAAMATLLGALLLSIFVQKLSFNRKIGFILVPLIAIASVTAGTVMHAKEVFYTTGYFEYLFEMIVVFNILMIGINLLYSGLMQKGINSAYYFVLYIAGILASTALPMAVFLFLGSRLTVSYLGLPIVGYSLGFGYGELAYFSMVAIPGITLFFCIYLMTVIKRNVPYEGGAGLVAFTMMLLLAAQFFFIAMSIGPV